MRREVAGNGVGSRGGREGNEGGGLRYGEGKARRGGPRSRIKIKIKINGGGGHRDDS